MNQLPTDGWAWLRLERDRHDEHGAFIINVLHVNRKERKFVYIDYSGEFIKSFDEVDFFLPIRYPMDEIFHYEQTGRSL